MVKLVRHADVWLRVQRRQREGRNDVLYELHNNAKFSVKRELWAGRRGFPFMRTVEMEFGA